MRLKEREKIARKLNTNIQIKIEKDFVYKVIEYNNLKILGGILLDTFNSVDSYRPHIIFLPLFIPTDFWYISYGWTMIHFHSNQEDESIKLMEEQYNQHIKPINHFEDIYNELIFKLIPNGASSLHYEEFLLYVSVALEMYNEFYIHLKEFKLLAKESLPGTWKDCIIQRVSIIENHVNSGDYMAAHKQLLQWQNYTIKMLKLPHYITVDDSSPS